jgi:beta-ureidopropionase
VTVIRAAITQTTWTGDKNSMLDKHEQFARDAKAQEAQVICFQELFYGPYFGITEDAKYYDYAEPADGPIVQRFAALAGELSMVMVLPIFEEEQPGIYYNTGVVVDADGTVLGQYRKNHIPNLDKFWEKRSSTSGRGTWDIRYSRPPSDRSGSTSVTTATFPKAGGSWV